MSNPQMQSMPLDDLVSRETLPIDVFLNVGERFLLVAKTGTPGAGLKKYKEKGVDRIFLRLHDYLHIVQIMIQEAGNPAGGENPTKRLKGIRKAMASVYREIEEIGFDENAFNHAKMINHVTLSFLAKNPRLSEMALKYEGGHEDLVHHAMMVSLISAMLGVAHAWIKPGTIEKLALGGFLHDIGKTKIPKPILDKQLKLGPGREDGMSPDELLIYRSYVEGGATLLAHVKTVPEDIILIVREHQEFADGSGYPRGIKDVHISPLARVVGMANVFTEELQKLEDHPADKRAQLAMDRMNVRSRQFNREAFAALQKLFNSDRSKIAV